MPSLNKISARFENAFVAANSVEGELYWCHFKCVCDLHYIRFFPTSLSYLVAFAPKEKGVLSPNIGFISREVTWMDFAEHISAYIASARSSLVRRAAAPFGLDGLRRLDNYRVASSLAYDGHPYAMIGTLLLECNKGAISESLAARIASTS